MTGADRWMFDNGYVKFSRKWFESYLRLPKQLVKHWYQRANRGYSVYDMWNADAYLADVIAGSAYWIFVHGHSHPSNLSEDEWNDVLLTIRDGFTVRDDSDSPDVSDLAWMLFQKYFRSFWD